MHIAYFLLVVVLLSLLIPAWEVSRQSDPYFKAHGKGMPFQLWFLGGIAWLAASLGVHACIMLSSIADSGNVLAVSLQVRFHYLLLIGWAVHAAVGAVLWYGDDIVSSPNRWRHLFFLFNAGCIVLYALPVHRAGFISFAVAGAPLWVFCIRQTLHAFRKKKDMTSLYLLSGTFAGGIGALLWIADKMGVLTAPFFGVHMWIIAGYMMVAAGVLFQVVARITSMKLYSHTLALCALCVLGIAGPLSFLNTHGGTSALGTVLGVGSCFAGMCISTILWMAFEELRQKNIDELAARWVSLGSWLPSGITTQFIGFGGWCLFLSSLLFAVSVFQNFSVHLMPTLWRHGLVILWIIGAGSSFYCAAAYAAWSEHASTPDARIAEIGYWHFMGGIIAMTTASFLGGLVLACQRALTAGQLQPEIIQLWQRPFLVIIGITDVMVFASMLIFGINLYRARTVETSTCGV